MADTVLQLWTVYDHPLDDPEHVVVRRWEIRPHQSPIPRESTAVETIHEARAAIQAESPGVCCLTRHPDDDPKIMEVWL